jgi:hypothetical protein
MGEPVVEAEQRQVRPVYTKRRMSQPEEEMEPRGSGLLFGEIGEGRTTAQVANKMRRSMIQERSYRPVLSEYRGWRELKRSGLKRSEPEVVDSAGQVESATVIEYQSKNPKGKGRQSMGNYF